MCVGSVGRARSVGGWGRVSECGSARRRVGVNEERECVLRGDNKRGKCVLFVL